MFRKSSFSPTRGVAARIARASWRVALIAFHAVLLAGRVSDASILEPAVLAKWCGALALVATATIFQRFAPVRLRGRRAVIVFWLLAAMLHLFGPLEHIGQELDLELTLGFAIPVIAFMILLAATLRAGFHARRLDVEQYRFRYLSPSSSPAAPRGPPSLAFQRALFI